METSLISLLNLELAWKRLKSDFVDGKIFIEFPNEYLLFEKNIENFLQILANKVASNAYNPSKSFICEVPKKGGSIRPAAYLEIEDRIIYTACVGACYEKIHQFIVNEIGLIDFSNQLSKDFNSSNWISSSFGGWDSFRKSSLNIIKDFANYIVIADVSACFENIDIACLIKDLRDIGCDSEILKLLSKCLNTWSTLEGRGIPQGYGASDILGKFYLSHIDKFLKDDYKHLRYVDDFRIFCSNKVEARKSLKDLVKALRFRGLNIQTEKTDIFEKSDAINEIEGIQPTIHEIAKEYESEIAQELDDPYINFFEFEKIAPINIEDTPIEVIKIAFEKYFVNNSPKKFDKTLFRFLIKRLVKLKSKYAVGHCLYAIENNPEETHTILNYLKQINLHEDAEEFSSILHFLATFLDSERAIYQYQNYLIIRYLTSLEFKTTPNLMKTIRNIVFEKKSELFLISAGLNFLAKYGNHADFEKIEYEFHSYHNKVQIEAIFALKSMERTKRNSFYSRISNVSLIHEKAVALAKTN